MKWSQFLVVVVVSLGAKNQSTKITNSSWACRLQNLTSNWFLSCLCVCFGFSFGHHDDITLMYCCVMVLVGFSESQKTLLFHEFFFVKLTSSHSKYLGFLWQYLRKKTCSVIFFPSNNRTLLFKSSYNLLINFELTFKLQKIRRNCTITMSAVITVALCVVCSIVHIKIKLKYRRMCFSSHESLF